MAVLDKLLTGAGFAKDGRGDVKDPQAFALEEQLAPVPTQAQNLAPQCVVPRAVEMPE